MIFIKKILRVSIRGSKNNVMELQKEMYADEYEKLERVERGLKAMMELGLIESYMVYAIVEPDIG